MDYKILFTKMLRARLQEKIKGKIFVSISNDDELYVEIDRFGDFTYELSIKDLSHKLLFGYSVIDAMNEVIQKYRKFVLKKYFR